MKTDVLTVIETGYDDSTGFYVNGNKVADIHCNDRHEIPGLLYRLMTKYNFAKVEERQLNDEAAERFFGVGSEQVHPETLDGYSDDDFE